MAWRQPRPRGHLVVALPLGTEERDIFPVRSSAFRVLGADLSMVADAAAALRDPERRARAEGCVQAARRSLERNFGGVHDRAWFTADEFERVAHSVSGAAMHVAGALAAEAAAAAEPALDDTDVLRVVFEFGPDTPDLTFVELEDVHGNSVATGQWHFDPATKRAVLWIASSDIPTTPEVDTP